MKWSENWGGDFQKDGIWEKPVFLLSCHRLLEACPAPRSMIWKLFSAHSRRCWVLRDYLHKRLSPFLPHSCHHRLECPRVEHPHLSWALWSGRKRKSKDVRFQSGNCADIKVFTCLVNSSQNWGSFMIAVLSQILHSEPQSWAIHCFHVWFLDSGDPDSKNYWIHLRSGPAICFIAKTPGDSAQGAGIWRMQL